MTASDPQPRPSPRPEKAADAEALYERFRALDIAFTAHRHDAVFTVEVNDTADDDAAVSVVLDAEMMQAPLVNYHPLVNTATVAMAPADLIRFLDVCRHSPRIVDLAPATRA